MKHVLIAGAAGFLGSHLVDHYLAVGDSVVGVDNLSTGRKENLSHITSDKFLFIEHDIAKPLPEAITSQKFDLIFSFACPASPPRYQALAYETLAVSSLGVKNLIELALVNDARLVHASTSEVYGDPSVNPQPESYWGNVNSYGERSMYDEGKRFAEAMLWVFQHPKGDTKPLNAGIVRIFNTYGPRMAPDDGRVVSNFIMQALKNEPITIYGDGLQTRSFGYVSDLIAGVGKLADSTFSEPVNIGNPNEFTMLELAEKVIAQTGSSSEIVKHPRPADDPKQRRPDITRAQKELNWQPAVLLDEGLQKTIEYFKNYA